MRLTIDPHMPICEKPQYFDHIVNGVRHLVNIQNADGSWGEEHRSTFQKIYYTTQVVQCLLKAGFPVASRAIEDAFAYLDNFREPSVENRARFFLYLPLGKLSQSEVRDYLEMLKKRQREDGSFFYEIRDLKGKEVTIDEWPGVRRGSFIFYTLHALHFLSMIDGKEYSESTYLKDEIWDPAWQLILTQLSSAKPQYTLKDPAKGLGDPELTSYAIGLLHKIGYQIPNFPQVVIWLLDKQVQGGWLNSPKVTSFLIIDLSTLSYDDQQLQLVKEAIAEAMRWLINEKERWEGSPNLTALVISALISGNIFLSADFQEAFFVNYTEVLREETREGREEIRRMHVKSRTKNVISFILGIAIELAVTHLIIPNLPFLRGLLRL